MDAARDFSDERLARISWETRQEYARVEREIRVKAEGILEAHDLTDAHATHSAWLRDGVDSLAMDLVRADESAMGAVRESMADVFAAGASTGSRRVSRESALAMARRDPGMLPSPEVDVPRDLAWNRRHIAQVMQQGIKRGDDAGDIAARLSDVIGMNERAAMRNARTAVNAAENAGRMDAMLERGGYKRWITVQDSRVRHSHAAIHGQVVPVDEPFDNGLMFPGDPSGPPGEIYNCRCVMEWVDTGEGVLEDVPVEDTQTFAKLGDVSDARRYFADDSAELKASAEHAEALHGYTAYSNRIQEYARETTGPRSVLETMDRYEGIPEQVRLMDEWIASRNLDEGLTVYRTLGQDTFERAVTDGIYRDSGFTSTTTDFDLVSYGNPNKPQSVWMEIQVPPGQGRGAYLEAVSEYSESEYLLPRGQEIRILGSRVDGEGRTIYQARVM